MEEAGWKFYQAEITSCGLNGAPLKDIGTYEARIACHLYSKNGTTESLAEQQDENHPAFTQEGEDRENNPNQYINNLVDGATAGFRYFEFKDATKISVTTRGNGEGHFVVKDERDGNVVAKIAVKPSSDWTSFCGELSTESGKHPLYFTFEGSGAVDFHNYYGSL